LEIFGLSIIAIGGLLLVLMLLFQVLTGSKKLTVNFRYHRINGYAILIVGLFHAFLGIAGEL
jgi:hypothetical protein